MKRLGKMRKYAARLLGGAGTIMALLTISGLMDYKEASERYWQRAAPIMGRITEIDQSAEHAADRDRLLRLFQTKLTAEEFDQHLALINRTYNDYSVQLTSEERFLLSSELGFRRLGKKESFILEHANLFLLGGFALIACAAFLERKQEPKPEAPAPPKQPWESVRPPAIAKGGCSVSEH